MVSELPATKMEGETLACDVDRSRPYLRHSHATYAHKIDALDRGLRSSARRARRELHSLRYSDDPHPATTPVTLAFIPEACGITAADRERRCPRRSDQPTRAEFPGSGNELHPYCWTAHSTPYGGFPTSLNHRFIQNSSKGAFDTKSDFSCFNGESCNEDYLDWEQEVDEFFYCACIPQERQVKHVIRKLTGRASDWWMHLAQARRLEGRGNVKTWHKMKRLLRRQFLTLDFEDLQQHTCSQVLNSMNMLVRRDELFNEQLKGVRKTNVDLDQNEHEQPYMSLNKKSNSTSKGDSSFKHNNVGNPFACSFNGPLPKFNLKETSAQRRKEGGSSHCFQKRLETPSTPGIIVIKAPISCVDGPGLGISSKEEFCVFSSDILLKDALTHIKQPVLLNFRHSDQATEEFMFKDSYCETKRKCATKIVAEVRRRDVGTEMTPLGSSKSSRCHTRMKSSFPTGHNTSTDRSDPFVVSNSRINNSELEDCHFAKLELSAQYDSLVSYGDSRDVEENFHYLKLSGETHESSYTMMLCLNLPNSIRKVVGGGISILQGEHILKMTEDKVNNIINGGIDTTLMFSFLEKKLWKKKIYKGKISPSSSRMMRTISIHQLKCTDFVSQSEVGEMASDGESSKKALSVDSAAMRESESKMIKATHESAKGKHGGGFRGIYVAVDLLGSHDQLKGKLIEIRDALLKLKDINFKGMTNELANRPKLLLDTLELFNANREAILDALEDLNYSSSKYVERVQVPTNARMLTKSASFPGSEFSGSAAGIYLPSYRKMKIGASKLAEPIFPPKPGWRLPF